MDATPRATTGKMNFNSTSGGQYTLQISNEALETSLPENDLSTANNFEVSLTPSLDLHQLSYLQSLDCECRTENIMIDSCPLIFEENEVIQTFVTITPELATGNLNYFLEDLTVRNQQPLAVGLTNFQTTEPQKALVFLNKLLQNSSNLYIITRYLEVLMDSSDIVKKDLFQNLNIDNEVNDIITIKDLNLLSKYVDIAIYSRIAVIEALLAEIGDSKLTLAKVLKSDDYQYSSVSPLIETVETDSLDLSKFLNPTKQQKSPTEVDFKAFKIVDTKKFYNFGFLPPKNASQITLDTEQKREIKDNLLLNLRTLGKLDRDIFRSLSETNTKYLKKVVDNNVALIKIATKLHSLIKNEKERLSLRKRGRLFTRHFLGIALDENQSKCRFFIDRSKVVADCTITVKFPRHASYKLGSARDVITRKYGLVEVGPISLGPPAKPPPKLANTIVLNEQRLNSGVRFSPRLLCLATDFLAESSRQQEKEQFFFSHHDMLTFFKVPLKPKYLGPHFLTVESSQLHPQPFHRVHKARMLLHTFKIMIFDENGEPILFPRDTFVKIALTFRPCLLSCD